MRQILTILALILIYQPKDHNFSFLNNLQTEKGEIYESIDSIEVYVLSTNRECFNCYKELIVYGIAFLFTLLT